LPYCFADTSIPTQEVPVVNKGDRIRVTLAGGEQVERLVWDATELGVLVCTQEGFHDAEQSGREPPVVGFRREYVEQINTLHANYE